jgi:hypothetical protein
VLVVVTRGEDLGDDRLQLGSEVVDVVRDVRQQDVPAGVVRDGETDAEA